MLQIASINSGSNGNCYYIGNTTEAVLIDAGISCREVEKRMERMGLDISRVKAIFISHEHSDHIFGLPVISRKYKLPVYITGNTLTGGRQKIEPSQVSNFQAYQPVAIGNISVTAFPKHHDAADPHSFIVSNNSVTIGVFTDIGQPCEHLIKHFSQCHAAFLESNYDEEMLLNGKYPWHLKNRIKGGKGHLSNKQAFDIFSSHRSPSLTHLLLSHLSKDNNDPELVQQLFAGSHSTNIIVASRYKESEVYEITARPQVEIPRFTMPIIKPQPRPVQLSIF